jgi:carbon-monoxide dehydrogenase small subunit
MEFDTLAELQAHFEAEHAGEPAIEGLVALNVNGQNYMHKVDLDWSLAHVLREVLGLTGTKIGCDRGSCGTCTVIMDGKTVYSCMVLAVEANGKDILTIEGLSDGITLHPIQQAFVDGSASQCGYCIPGYIMAAKVLLDKNSNPSRDDAREALSGHFCPCGNTKKILDAVLSV